MNTPTEASSLHIHAQQFSELLLLNTTLGNGCQDLFPDLPGMVFASGISSQMQHALRAAEKGFHHHHAQITSSDREALKAIEAQIPTAPTSALQGALRARAEELKQQLNLNPDVSWRDHDVHRSTLIELLKKSAYRSMAFVDELGTRTAVCMAIPVKLSQEASLASLTMRSTNDVTLIRSSTSGGSSIHSLVGADSVAFRYISCIDETTAQRLCKRISSKDSNAAMRGHTIVIPAQDADAKSLPYGQNEILTILKQVYVRGATPGRELPVRFESPQVQADWEKFLKISYQDLCGREPSETTRKLLRTMPASLRTLALYASKAALTQAVYTTLLATPGAHEVVLTASDLEQAKTFATTTFVLASGTTFLDTRASNAAKAREANAPSAAKVQAASDALTEAILAAPGGVISRFAAVSLPGVTAGIPDTLVARDSNFVALNGKENIKQGKITRGYVLRATYEMDQQEALAEFAQAVALNEPTDPAETEAVFKDLQAEAVRIDQEHYVCAVPITKMTSRHIRHLPSILAANPADVALRGTAANPEPPHLLTHDNLEEDEEESCILKADIPNLWFRFKPDGSPFRDWERSRLNFPQWKHTANDSKQH